MIILNLLLFVVAIWVAVSINHSYIQTALKNAQRFKLFRLRYRLHALAMRGVVSEKSPEYVVLLNLINQSIRASASFKVTDFLLFLSRLPDDEKLKESVECMVTAIRDTNSPEFCEIASDYFEALRLVIRDDTRLLRNIIQPIIAIASSLNFFRSAISEIQRRVGRIESASSIFGQYEAKFRDFCSC